jgi:hypothetical protein
LFWSLREIIERISGSSSIMRIRSCVIYLGVVCCVC